MKRAPRTLLTGLSALTAAWITGACGTSAPAAEPPRTADGTGSGAVAMAPRAPTPVRTVEAEASPGNGLLRTSGTVASQSESELTFKIAGYVSEVRVEEGDRVAAGQILARLQMTEVDARLRAAEARAELAEKQFRRMERLFTDSVVPAVQLDEARSAYQSARAELEVARFDHSTATIRAPSDGRILTRFVEVAEFTTPGAPAFRFGSTSQGWIVRVHVADHQVVRIAPGSPARVVVPGLDPDGVSGRVVEVADAADPRSGTFEIEVEIDAGAAAGPQMTAEAGAARGNGSDGGLSAARLRSGMIAEVELELAGAETRVFLPLHAVVDAVGRTGSVFVVEGDRAVRREVRIVEIGAQRVGVEGADLAGTTVVTAGAAYLSDGDVVSLVSSH